MWPNQACQRSCGPQLEVALRICRRPMVRRRHLRMMGKGNPSKICSGSTICREPACPARGAPKSRGAFAEARAISEKPQCPRECRSFMPTERWHTLRLIENASLRCNFTGLLFQVVSNSFLLAMRIHTGLNIQLCLSDVASVFSTRCARCQSNPYPILQFCSFKIPHCLYRHKQRRMVGSLHWQLFLPLLASAIVYTPAKCSELRRLGHAWTQCQLNCLPIGIGECVP